MNPSIIPDLLLRSGSTSPKTFAAYLRVLPRFVLEKFRRGAFRRTLRWAAHRSPYYHERLGRLGIKLENVRGPENLGSFFIEPKELRETPELFLCGRPYVAIESSGTTGHASRVFLSQKELNYNARQGILLQEVYGITRDDRVISTFDYGFCLDGQLVQRSLPYWKCFTMSVGRADPQEIYRRMASYGFNVVMSGTPWLSRFTEVAEEGGRPFPLKLLVGGGGGGILQSTREKIENFWGAPLCMTYGSTEAASLLGFECLRREGYHLNEFDFFLEILDPDEDGYGEVVMTTMSRSIMPLIRYRTKDVARFIREPCPCGLPFRRLSPLRGRLDEIVASVWGNVHPDFFEKILAAVPGITDEWQVALRERRGKQTFEFRMEAENVVWDKEGIEKSILRNIEARHPLAWQAYQQGLAEVRLVFHPKGTLRKGRKLLRLVDERRSTNG